MQYRRKYSKKRQAILDALCADKRHPTAEMLYTSLKPVYPELSLGTVYRNLAVLMEEGAISSVGHIDGQERYDGRMDSHGHFICRGCHRILDLEAPELLGCVCAELSEGLGCTAEAYSFSVSGFCRDCRKGN